jgi:hypothetical protein
MATMDPENNGALMEKLKFAINCSENCAKNYPPYEQITPMLREILSQIIDAGTVQNYQKRYSIDQLISRHLSPVSDKDLILALSSFNNSMMGHK